MMISITHLKKARAIYNLLGEKDGAKNIDTKISVATAIRSQDANGQYLYTAKMDSVLEIMKSDYENELKRLGMDSVCTLLSGLSYARALKYLARTIEAERLATKLSAISCAESMALITK